MMEEIRYKHELVGVYSKRGGQPACYCREPGTPVPHLLDFMGFISVEVLKFTRTDSQPLKSSTDFTNKAIPSNKSL
jgi:hypothetical protein